MTEADVRKLLDRVIEEAGGLRAFCREHDIDHGLVSRIVNGKKPLAPAILDAIKIEKRTVTTYKRKGKR
jgi:hypothetical protein